MGDFSLLLPELVVLLAALVAFAGSALTERYRPIWAATTLVAAAAVVVTAALFTATGSPLFEGIYQVDAFSQLLKLGLTVGLLLTLLASCEVPTVRAVARPDLPIFLTLSTLGMMLLVSATELLTLYVALELSAYGLYVMAALHKDQRMAGEAGVKYLLFGGGASAITLYGLSLVFGAAGSTYLSDVVQVAQAAPSALFVVGVVLTLSGLFFKLAVLPFHAWAPDTYQGSPHQVATFIGTTSKVAAVGVLVRVLTLGTGSTTITTLLVALAIVSMTVGNLAALAQRDVKRLLAWSTVAHAGYVLLGVVTLSEVGVASALFYGIVYLIVAFCAFLVVTTLGRGGSNPTLSDLTGLYKRAPLIAIVLLAGMFGLAGVPPTPGFAGKWFIFSAAMQGGLFWLVLIGAINATISLYYYLRVVRAAYQTAAGDGALPLTVTPASKLAAVIAMALVAFTGFYPGPLWDLAERAARALMGG
ncbi:MAG: NADH-quinone oxidoreductase subunit N [Proteobacteria bacterium]|nr:MAG: NADH-quinone oxidoreductase subunit N [Pseudomonadota bacterium]